MKKFIKAVFIVAVISALGAGGFWGWKKYSESRGAKVVFHTEEVKRSDVMSVINASGTVEPEELVNVGFPQW